jgi:hypothetical protein
MLLFAVLMQAISTVVRPGQTAAWGVFGAMLLREDAGGYVLVAVVSFAAAAAITALCMRFRIRENRKEGGTGKPGRGIRYYDANDSERGSPSRCHPIHLYAALRCQRRQRRAAKSERDQFGISCMGSHIRNNSNP